MADDSFLDEDERNDESFKRNLRKEQREIVQDLQKNRDDLSVPEKLLEKLGDMNAKFQDVVATREACIDSEGFLLLSEIGREQVQAIQGEALEFDTSVYAEKLITLMGGRRGYGVLDWGKLGEKALKDGVFRTAPPVSFMYGALDIEPLKKRVFQRKKPEKLAAKATKLKEVNDLTDEEESTTKDVSYIFSQVQRGCETRGRLHYLKFLVDPKSFARSVENFFHFSFLIKDGRAGVTMGKDGQPYIYLPSDTNESGQSVKTEKKQFIMSLDMRDWRRIIEKYDLRKAAFPPRV